MESSSIFQPAKLKFCLRKAIMAAVLHPFCPKSPVALNLATKISLPRRPHTCRCTANDEAPPEPVRIRYRGVSKRRQRQRKELEEMKEKAPSKVPKTWEKMSMTEKAIELYVGEKGLLFWLNNFAYASIYIIIGAWILFRFVGPALNLYQLDAPPLTPTSLLKGS